MIRRTLIVIFLAVMTVPVVASPCWACTCAASGNEAADRRAQAENADLIFTGIAKKIRVDDPAPDDAYSGDEKIYVRFRVHKTYKGYPREWRWIYTGVYGDTCRYEFEVGDRYTVFAYKHKGEFNTNICTGTKRGRINPDNYGLDD